MFRFWRDKKHLTVSLLGTVLRPHCIQISWFFWSIILALWNENYNTGQTQSIRYFYSSLLTHQFIGLTPSHLLGLEFSDPWQALLTPFFRCLKIRIEDIKGLFLLGRKNIQRLCSHRLVLTFGRTLDEDIWSQLWGCFVCLIRCWVPRRPSWGGGGGGVKNWKRYDII